MRREKGNHIYFFFQVIKETERKFRKLCKYSKPIVQYITHHKTKLNTVLCISRNPESSPFLVLEWPCWSRVREARTTQITCEGVSFGGYCSSSVIKISSVSFEQRTFSQRSKYILKVLAECDSLKDSFPCKPSCWLLYLYIFTETF